MAKDVSLSRHPDNMQDMPLFSYKPSPEPEPVEPSTMPTLSYVAEEVRQHDRDRFLCALFAPEKVRESLFALLAFNLEVAKTRETTSEPMLGLMRLQWWREAIEQIFAGNVRHHAVVEAVAEVNRETPLTREYIDELIVAREADVESTPLPSIEALIHYTRATSGNLLRLMLEALGIKDDAAFEAADAIGIGWAMVGLLRAAQIQFRQGYSIFPVLLMHKHGMNPDMLGTRDFVDSAKPAVEELTTLANGFIKEGKRLSKTLSQEVRERAMPVLLLGVLADGYIRRIIKADFDVFGHDIEGRKFTLQLRLLKSAMMKRF
ncbi:MAG: squalene/phytoene synthase family protein [Proteobacteria bacterium]|nr:squalene/phytoene synthase family protein [Pseudomonadota bacterium]